MLIKFQSGFVIVGSILLRGFLKSNPINCGNVYSRNADSRNVNFGISIWGFADGQCFKCYRDKGYMTPRPLQDSLQINGIDDTFDDLVIPCKTSRTTPPRKLGDETATDD